MVCIFFKYLLGTFHVLKTLASLKTSRAFLFKYSMCVGRGESFPHLPLWHFTSVGEAQYKAEKQLRRCSVFFPKAAPPASEALGFFFFFLIG